MLQWLPTVNMQDVQKNMGERLKSVRRMEGSTHNLWLAGTGNSWTLPWRNSPWWARASSLSRLYDHNQTQPLGTPALDEWSARRRELYLTTHNTHKRQTSMPTGGIRTYNPTERATEGPSLWPLWTTVDGTDITTGKQTASDKHPVKSKLDLIFFHFCVLFLIVRTTRLKKSREVSHHSKFGLWGKETATTWLSFSLV